MSTPTVNQVLMALDYASVQPDNAPDMRRVLTDTASELRAVTAREPKRDASPYELEAAAEKRERAVKNAIRTARLWGVSL